MEKTKFEEPVQLDLVDQPEPEKPLIEPVTVLGAASVALAVDYVNRMQNGLSRYAGAFANEKGLPEPKTVEERIKLIEEGIAEIRSIQNHIGNLPADQKQVYDDVVTLTLDAIAKLLSITLEDNWNEKLGIEAPTQEEAA